MTRRRGSYTIEMALTVPVWALATLWFLEIGWFLFHLSILDLAVDRGCRAGSLLDPGERDEKIGVVTASTRARVLEELEDAGLACMDCDVAAWTVGAPPRRTLVCQARRSVSSPVGLAYTAQWIESQQVTRLEWQREAAP